MNSVNSNVKKLNIVENLGLKGSSSSIMTYILIFIGIALVVGGIAFLIHKYLYLPSAIKIPTTANMNGILAKRKTELKSLYEGIDRKKGLAPLETNQNFLVNYHTLFQQAAGYMGPYENGVIDPASAVQLSLSCGSRGFMLPIEDVDGKPMIIVRDSRDKKLSLNDVYASDLIDAIVANAFKESIEGRANTMRYDPCIIYLNFNGNVSSACAQSVANTFNKHRSVLLSTNEKGDFTHRRNEDKLFLLTPADVAGKIVVVCNIDTNRTEDGFNPKKSSKIGLDYYINGRVWNYLENKVDAGVTSVKSIFTTSYGYLHSLNEDGITMIKRDSRLKYFIINNFNEKVNIKKITEYGLQGVGGFPFDSKEDREAFAKGGFAKAKELRYIVPEPMQVSPAPKEMNSGGGMIAAPKLG
jgi:hypothetical protein